MNKRLIFAGLVLSLFGTFLLFSPMQAISCHYDGECAGVEWFLQSIYFLDNIYLFILYESFSGIVISFGIYLIAKGTANE